MSEFTIGGFAEDLISQELGKVQEDPSYIAEAVSSERPQEDVPDLRKVVVPKNFVNEVLGEATEEVEEPVNEKSSDGLFDKLHSLVKELDSVLTEMTMTGHIGVNVAGPGITVKKIKRDSQGYMTPATSSASRMLRKLSRSTKKTKRYKL